MARKNILETPEQLNERLMGAAIFVKHLTCGMPVTWRFGTETREGGAYCNHCQADVPDDELPRTGPICLASPQ